MKLPFFTPENELALRLGRLLLLFKQLSFNKKGNPTLSIEKVVFFEFLSKYPEILNKLLITENKRVIELEDSEIQSIEVLFPNRKQLFNLTETKNLVNILIASGYIDIKIENGFNVHYTINPSGRDQAQSLKSDYFMRIDKLFEQTKPFQSYSFSKLYKLIEPYIKNGLRD